MPTNPALVTAEDYKRLLRTGYSRCWRMKSVPAALDEMRSELELRRVVAMLVRGPFLSGTSFWVEVEAGAVERVSVSLRWWQLIARVRLAWVKLCSRRKP